MKKLLFCLIPLLSLPSFSQVNIGTVDMARAFSEFYKTKSALAEIQEQMAVARKEMNEKMAVRNKIVEAAQKLDKEVKDPVLNNEVRQQKMADLQTKLNELRSAEQEIQDFGRRRQEQIANEQAQQRRGLYQEVLGVVQTRAKTAGLDIIVDKSSVGITQMNTFLYVGDKVTDLTNEIVVELNKNAPPENATPAPEGPAAPATAPAPPAEATKPGGN